MREASDQIQILTKERDYYKMKMTFYAKDAEREGGEDIINNYKHGSGWGKDKDE